MKTEDSKGAGDFKARWRGREDAEEVGDARRWHHAMRPFDASAGRGEAVLIGFPCDEGVKRNGGRSGAAGGPAALRAALANLPYLDEPPLSDAGDVCGPADSLEVAQSKLGEAVAHVLKQDALPLALGGGHEIAWGTFQGIAAAQKHARLLIVNLDAHFDLRQAKQPNSGTPFRQIHDWCAAGGRPFDYRVLGISRYANTRALFDRADSLGVRYWCDEALQAESHLATAEAALSAELKNFDAVYLTVCLDVLPSAVAPGVSAPGVLGVPLAHVERLIDLVAGCGKLIAADIAEFNPGHDRDGITARVAARLVARIVCGAGKSSKSR